MNLTRRHSGAFIVGSRARNFARKNVCRLGAYFTIAAVDVVGVARELTRCALPTSSGAWRLPSVGSSRRADEKSTDSEEAHDNAYDDSEGALGGGGGGGDGSSISRLEGASADVRHTADGVPMSALRRYAYGFNAPLAKALSCVV